MDQIVVFFDGACEPINPGGVGTYAFVVRGAEAYSEAGIACEPGPHCTNNVAEYTGLVKALRWLRARGIKGAVVKGDSQLVIRQVQGIYAVRSERLKPLYEEARALAKEVGAVLMWIPREKNLADELTKAAYISYLDTRPDLVEAFRRYFAGDDLLAEVEALGLKPYKYMSRIDAMRLIRRAAARRRAAPRGHETEGF
ncbi:MAG: ribonuclease HI [Thermoproteus sp. AZ2]|uniref:Ribonuclease HI n=1 Tax=Thermoproteus sp. AZ2 TaxID=1609232 RepID=A0ACC6UZ26_9CREN